MKFFILIIFFIFINIIVITNASWGHNEVLSPNDLQENKNTIQKYFENGLKPHTMKIGFRLKNSQHNEVEMFSLTSASNKLSLKYYKNEHKVILHLNVDINNKTSLWGIHYPNINLEVGGWHFIVYFFGKIHYKMWIDCELKKSTNSDLKTLMNLDDDVFKYFGNPVLLNHGDSDDIDYNKKIEFLDHPAFTHSFDDRYTCERIFNFTKQIRVNTNDTEGTFYPLNLFQDVLKTYDSPGVYYEIDQSALRDVSEYFEDGLDKDHSFEITYRIKEFPQSNHSYYFIMLKSGGESTLSIALHGKRSILKIFSSIYNHGKLSSYTTEYWADQIYNNNWHTIKYTLKNGTLTLWIDDELMEDFLGFKHVDLKYEGYDDEYLWYSTGLMIMEPRSGLHQEPVLHIRTMKFYGNAITTNNTEISLNPEETHKTNRLNSFFKVIGRIFI